MVGEHKPGRLTLGKKKGSELILSSPGVLTKKLAGIGSEKEVGRREAGRHSLMISAVGRSGID